MIEAAAEVRGLLDRLVAVQEEGLSPPWSSADVPENFVTGMQRGLVAFEIPVSRLEAKAKLSQNKTAAQQAAATAVVEQAEDFLARATGEWMRRALEARTS